MGDAQVFIRTAAFNFNVAGFFTKWQDDIADAQPPATGSFPMFAPNVSPRSPDRTTWASSDGGPAWADAGIICPWTIHLCYGDTRLLERHYDSFRRYVESLRRDAIGLIRCHPDNTRWGGFGDWLALDGSLSWEGNTPKDLIGTAFFAHSARLLSKIAAVLGHAEDAAQYEALANDIRAAFQARFITPEGLVAGGTQTAMVLALHFELAPEALRPVILNTLVRHIEANGDKLATGFVGTVYLPHVLTCGGRLDVAYRLLHQKQWPSWLYAVTQGATTIWERWDGWTQEKGFQTPDMNSFNHYAYGAVGEWLYGTVAGLELDPAQPGYKHTMIQPHPGGGLA
jgi:alpha-L-rhamnosidase